MKIARIEFAISTESSTPSVIGTVYDAKGEQLHRCAAEYKDDPNFGAARILDKIAGVMREAYKEADGSLSFTFHK